MRDLIKRISKAEEMIEQKPNQNSIDCTIYGVLNDCKSVLKSQQDRIEKMSSLLGEAYKELERLKAEAEKAFISGQNNILEVQAEGR